MIQMVSYRNVRTSLLIQSDVVFTKEDETFELQNIKEETLNRESIDVSVIPLDSLNITKYIYPSTKDYIGDMIIFRENKKIWMEQVPANKLNQRLEENPYLEASILNIAAPTMTLALYPDLVTRRIFRFKRYKCIKNIK